MPAFRDSPSVIFWPFLAMVVLAPVPLGSIYPWSSTLISTFTGILLLGWAVQAAIGSGQPAVGLKKAWPFILPFILVAAWIVIQIVPWTPESWHHPLWKTASEILGEDIPGRITLDADKSINGLMRLLTYGGIFWLALQYGRDPRNARRIFMALAIFGSLFAIYGLAMELSGLNLVLWYDKKYYIGSVTSVFHYKNSYATYASMGLLCVLGLFLEAVSERGEPGTGRAESRRQMVTWVAERGWIPLLALVTLSSALILTDSRAGALSGVLGVFVLLALVQVSHMKGASYIRSMTAISLAIILGFFVIGGASIWERGSSTDPSGDIRVEIFETVAKAINDAPLRGTGSGTFADVFPFYQPDTFHRTALRAHNSYLENALELGIPAALLMLVAIFIPVSRCIRGTWSRRRRAVYPLIAVAVATTVGSHALLDFTMQVPAVAVTFFTILGVGCAQSWNSTA